MKIMIATPCHSGELPIEYVASLLDTLRASEHLIAPVFLGGEAMLPHARNHLAKLFLDSDFDVLFFIDADMQWTPEQFLQIATSEKSVLSGIARQKRVNGSFNFREKKGATGGPILEVDSVGCAFIKISREALEKIKVKKYTAFGQDWPEFFEYGKQGKELMSEDITFCRKLQSAGEKIFVDLSVLVGHLGKYMYR